MKSEMTKVMAIWIAVMALPMAAFSAITTYSTDFENPIFVVGDSVNGIDGWTDNGNGIIRDAAYDTWGTHGKYLTAWGPSAFNYAPVIDTSAQAKAYVSLDFRPADGTTEAGQNGGWIGLYGTGSGSDTGVTTIRFESTAANTGNIVATDAGYSFTLGTWNFVDSNTNYHFDMVVDNVAKTTSVSVNGGTNFVLAWGGYFGSSVSSGTFNQLWFRGGLNATRAMTAVDNIAITVPEPAALSLLLLGTVIATMKRRKN